MEELKIYPCGSSWNYCSGKCSVCPTALSITSASTDTGCSACEYGGRPTYDWPCTACIDQAGIRTKFRPKELG